MSRSRPPKCPCGRGCFVCGDNGEARRAREEDQQRADARDLEAELEAAERDRYLDQPRPPELEE